MEHIDNSKLVLTDAAFMATHDAQYSKIHDRHMALSDGAVLVRAGKEPVDVSTEVQGHVVKTRVSAGALVMVSAFDGKTTLLHLTDKASGSIVTTLPTERADYKVLALAPGQIAEVYSLKEKPSSHLVSRRIHINERLSDDKGLLVSQCHYVRALKKFNLVPVMQKDDYNRVLKTAAAISYVKP